MIADAFVAAQHADDPGAALRRSNVAAPVPNIEGQLLKPGTKVRALECWDNVRGVAPDGHDPVNNPAKPVEATYRITAASPPPGTSIGRRDVVTIQLAAVDPKAAPASRPCDWVTTSEAAGFLGGPVTARPSGDEAGSVDMSCDYDRSGEIGKGIQSDLLVAGAFPVDAASEFALWATENVTTVGGLGVKAACVPVLLNGDRLYRAIGGYVFCDTLRQFAQAAIGRIGA
jgi:hypothetical protein